jgi:probable rRNA maturation factor
MKTMNVNIINYFNNVSYDSVINPIKSVIEEKLNVTEEINVVFCDDSTIKGYNKQYRFIDRSTDVLSFPNSDENDQLGDIIISIETAIKQSEEYHHSLDREIGFLFCHGILHCLGYDHHTKDEEEVMFKLQKEIMDQANLRR